VAKQHVAKVLSASAIEVAVEGYLYYTRRKTGINDYATTTKIVHND
jgi:hypothetical protein